MVRAAASDGSSGSSPPESNGAVGRCEGSEEKLLGKSSPSNPLRRSIDGPCPKSTSRSSERIVRAAASDGSSGSSPPESNGAVGRCEGSEEKLLGKSSPYITQRSSIDSSCTESTYSLQ